MEKKLSEYIPTQDELNDKLWRLTNLYYITNKSGAEVLFDLNWAQKELFHKEWHQMLVLKARVCASRRNLGGTNHNDNSVLQHIFQ